MHKICFTISLFHASTCFEHHVLIVRRSKLYCTASGIITPIGGRPVHRLREDCSSQSFLIVADNSMDLYQLLLFFTLFSNRRYAFLSRVEQVKFSSALGPATTDRCWNVIRRMQHQLWSLWYKQKSDEKNWFNILLTCFIYDYYVVKLYCQINSWHSL